MIYFFYGLDKEKANAKARGTFDALKKKKPDASFVTFSGENLTLADLDLILGAQGLFEKKMIFRYFGFGNQ
jgi:hypothetical protein